VVNPKHLQTLPAVEANVRDVQWTALVQDGPPVEFPPETVYRFKSR